MNEPGPERLVYIDADDGLELCGAAFGQRTDAAARQMVVDGRGAELMPPRPDAPSWNLICAATLYGRAQRIENVFGLKDAVWATVDVPTLVVFGGAEDNVDADIAVLRAGWSSSKTLTCQVIAGADHNYHGRLPAVAEAVVDWLAGLG